MCCAVALFACLDTMAKYLNTQMNAFEVVWARYTSAFLLTLFVSNPFTEPGLMRSRRPLLQFTRGTLLVASTALNFLALRWLQLDEALSIIFTFPFIVAIASGPMLGEWIGWRRWTAIGVGFAGVLLIVRPGFQGMHPAAGLSFAATICYGLYAVTTRIASRFDSNQTSLFYNNAVGAALMLMAGRASDPLVEIALTLLAAYGAFWLADGLHVSGVLATLAAGMLVGNWGKGRHLSAAGGQAALAFWEFAAFLANSLVFLLIGSREAAQPITAYLWPAAMGTLAVLAGRAAAIYPLGALFARSRLAMDRLTQHILFWGGLRGALAIALALEAPASLPEHAALVSTAFAVVAFSIFVQGLSVPRLLARA